jgi:hypothetical protein
MSAPCAPVYNESILSDMNMLIDMHFCEIEKVPEPESHILSRILCQLPENKPSRNFCCNNKE